MPRTVLVFATTDVAPRDDLVQELLRLEGVVTASDVDREQLVLAVECDDVREVVRRVRDAVISFDGLAREIYQASTAAAELFVRPA